MYKLNIPSECEEIKDTRDTNTFNPKFQEAIYYRFENNIGLLALFISYNDENINDIYKLIQLGYINNDQLSINTAVNKYIDFLIDDKKTINYEISEAFLFHGAFVKEEFDFMKDVKKAVFSVHKLVNIDEAFVDKSERDLFFTYGAKNVERGKYRWACCIASQNISYIYANKDLVEAKDWESKISENLEDDLALTILALHQKYTCINLNEEFHNTINLYKQNSRKKVDSKKALRRLKEDALMFKAYGTITPARISIWDSVCQTYKSLLELNDVNATLEEIEVKLNLLEEWEKQNNEEAQGAVGKIIAVFGLVAIVDSTLSVIDLLNMGETAIKYGFISSIIGIIAFPLALLLWMKKQKNR